MAGKQRDVAEIMNKINEVIEELGYIAVGYDNTGMYLLIMIDREDEDG